MTANLTPLARSLEAAGFRGALLCGEPLASHTTWRMGGPAELMARPADAEDAVGAVLWAERSGTPWRVLGNGSNLLVREAGVRGLVLQLRKALDGVRDEPNGFTVGAGALYPVLANRAVGRGLEGLEFAAGIPGTVGGAVIMNAGWHEHETAGAVESVSVMEPDGRVRTLGSDACGFGYRKSSLRGGRSVVLEVRFALHADDPGRIQARMDEFAASRRANQPTELPSCGSVFLKPPGDFAGRLIDEAGLKGQRVGDVQVSPLHANFFVNLGSGNASDALALVERVETAVEERFGVKLEREFELW